MSRINVEVEPLEMLSKGILIVLKDSIESHPMSKGKLERHQWPPRNHIRFYVSLGHHAMLT